MCFFPSLPILNPYPNEKRRNANKIDLTPANLLGGNHPAIFDTL